MNTTLTFLVVLFYASACDGQEQSNCYQSTKYKSLEKKIPADICLTSGELEFEEITFTDFDNDGLEDFIAKWQPKKLTDGDTLQVSAYRQYSAGRYKLYKTWNNLYPIYFKDYSLEYAVKDSLLNEVKANYPGYPTKEVKFSEDKLLLHFEAGLGSHYFLHYRYDSTKGNWYLERRIYSESDHEGNLHQVSSENLMDQFQSIDEFNYFDYL